MTKQRRLKSQKERRQSRLKNNQKRILALDVEFAKRYLETLLIDAKNILHGQYSFTDFSRDVATLKNRMSKEGLSFATNTLPSYATALLEYVEYGEASFPQYKLKRGMGYPVFLHRLFYLATQSTDQTIRYRTFDILYSLCVAFKKLKGEYPSRILCKQFRDFVEVDKSLGDIDWFESTTYFILHYARECFRGFFSNADLSSAGFKPRPGPGATNTKTKKTARYEPHVLYNQIDKVFPYQEWFYPTPWDACHSARDFLLMYNNRVESPVSRFKFVAKTYGKARGICIEENEMQVLQQSVRNWFANQIHGYKWLNICLPLENQSVNATLALKSSLSREDATIDESEASDRVARELVSWISQDTPLHDPLMALSTRYVQPPKVEGLESDLIRVNKYAPMGSGLCFPVMSLVHLFLIWGIMFYAYPNQTDLWKRVRVYGDDIVVPSYTVEKIYELLPRFGMKLNTKKSFYKGYFRESCGTHAYYGSDVTPVYLKYTPNHNKSAKAHASAIAVESLLYKKGFASTAKLIRAEYGIDGMPSHPSQSLASIQRTNESVLTTITRQRAQFKRRWNEDYQCFEFRVKRLKKPSVVDRICSERAALLRWHWLNPESDSRLISDSHGDLSFRYEWVPESAL